MRIVPCGKMRSHIRIVQQGRKAMPWAALCCQNVNKLFTSRSHFLTLHRKVRLYVQCTYSTAFVPDQPVRTTVQPAAVRCQARKLRIFAILRRKVFPSNFQETLSTPLTDFLGHFAKRVFSVKKPRNLVNRVDRLFSTNRQNSFLGNTSKILRKLLD